jgi:hypothetical protein
MAPDRFKVGTTLALSLIMAFVLVHPDIDLLDGVFHPSHALHQDLTSSMTSVFEGPPVVATTSPLDATPVLTAFRLDSLDRLCVRLC